MVPLFKSHYSLHGRSILTLEKAGSKDKKGPDSIFDIAVDNGLKEVFLVEDNMTGFLEAESNARDANIKLIFGLRISINEDCEDKSESNLKKKSKYIIFAKNASGYRRLIKIYTHAATKGFYYEPTIDFKSLRPHWNEDDLTLCIPFYDSFLFNNILEGHICVPDFSFSRPKFFSESNDLPFDYLVQKRVEEFCASGFEIIKAKSIYYKDRVDFLAYLTFKCISNRSSLSKPQFDHMSSKEFCFESLRDIA